MFDYIIGKVISCENGSLILEVGGVGFHLKVPLTTEIYLKPNSQAKVLTQLVIRDDSMKLFGFCTPEERMLFQKLQSISGVGPASALAILSGGPPGDLREAILSEDLSFFKKVKGVGPKTAKRIILELKGYMQNLKIESVSSSHGGIHKDAIAALLALGFPQALAMEAVDKALHNTQGEISLDDLVRESIKELS